MTAPLQAARAARVKTALDGDTLVLSTASGFDALSRPFELCTVLVSERADLRADALLGTRLSLLLDTAEGVRELNGIVASFSIVEPGADVGRRALFRYEAIVRPTLWLLTRGRHCRFFHARSVLEIVESVLADYHVDYRNACTARYPKLDHCAQYNESDFDFVSRLLERDGIYYYFEHESGRDRLVLADTPSAPMRGCAIPFAEVRIDAWPLAESVYRWRFEQQLTTGTAELTAFDFDNAKASAQQQALVARASADTGERHYVAAEYETHYVTQDDGRRLAQARIDALQTASACATGASTARALAPGRRFTLTGHPRADQNDDYLVVEAHYRIQAGDYVPGARAATREEPVFHCTFKALPSRYPFRPARTTPRPHAGAQSAWVLAPDGDEMATQRHGCVKVQFHWEQLDPPSAGERLHRCWVRVAQGWAGRNWGMVFMPRAGQEVIVDFIDGDPDRPVLVGSLYNSANPPPYALPAHESMSAIRSASLAGDGERNELRFDDKNLQLLLYTGGRADSYVKRNSLSWVGEDAHAIVEGKQFVKVGAQDFTIEDGQRVKVGASASLSAGVDIVQAAGVNYCVRGEIVHIEGGASVVIEASAMLTLKCGGSFITITPAGVQVSGPIVALNSGGAAGSAPGGSVQAPSSPKKADDGSGAR
ncbi:type VI secretion system tip protein VgrG [Trinickia dabaoshanensis]|uniref:Type VI secretion system tip protein VgrG n=1 Tax=Trinickia dabaoshanensis TaxID=564714 RepID=A0A2N7VTF3_9BURK|nr:type VI secretion system tip protein TssI/VgrG [Trinickia dabaoshanensis]PMS20433.1 type VI secretion system tip protein VgrG [Trinickia dabaoshanensis]